jgi:hypothetical protein
VKEKDQALLGILRVPGPTWVRVKEPTLKRTALAALPCAVALVASLAACDSGDDKPTAALYTGGSTSPTTEPVALAALATHSTSDYAGLKLVVNLPSNVPSASRPSLRVFSDFLQGVGRTTAQNKLDPSLSGLASAEVVKQRQNAIEKASVQGIGPVIFTVSSVHTIPSGPTAISGCIDQSKLVQIRKDGSRYVDAGTKKYGRLRMSASLNANRARLQVTSFTFAVGTC